MQLNNEWWRKWRKSDFDVSMNQVARKLAMVEADLERAEERAEQGER